MVDECECGPEVGETMADITKRLDPNGNHARIADFVWGQGVWRKVKRPWWRRLLGVLTLGAHG